MRPINVPDVIARAMQDGAALAISISGGKDSQAMLAAVMALHRERQWPGDVYAIHAHLGAAEWRQTLGHCRNLCARLGIELVEVARSQGDLPTQIEARMEKLAGSDAPPWPDAKNRYCTSDQKRGQIEKVYRGTEKSPWPSSTQRYCTADQKRDQLVKRHRAHEVVVAAMGMRAGESPARAKRKTVGLGRITAAGLKDLSPIQALDRRRLGQRVALDWLPIHEWSVEDVWEACGHSTADLERRQALYRSGQAAEAFAGWLAHPAYVMGNDRLSCSICILASRSDIVNGAAHNPELYRRYVEIERRSGFTFRVGLSLADLEEEIAAVPVIAAVGEAEEEVSAHGH